MKCSYSSKLFTLDWDDIDEDVCLRRLQEILDNYANVQKLVYRQSPSKSGYHVRGICYSSTNNAALRFKLQDDPRRILNDIFNRPDNVHNVLYDRKTVEGTVLYAGEWKFFKPTVMINNETYVIDS